MSDWDNVTVIGRKAKRGSSGPREKVLRSSGALNAARRQGAITAVEKKYYAGNVRGDPEGQHLTKVDRSDDIVIPKKLDMNVGKAIQKARQDKKWNQKDLAQRINEKPTIVNEYEAGKGVPNQQVLAKMERALGVKLRGKNIGAPLFKRKKK
ncbi:multiprotein-bridging factor 1 [Brettanomyces bruxellensis]|uniref:DEBR0S4_14114g1_1 n=1 Tax=Dekkera bruxellensis TaxID=5007 RepID=A0A3F2Y594_DEKBR|nr:multiprotein-bridging factor 1 [Brettanomyces bruxellensis]EIF45807.1 multiprotein-bridging factor 1 [Brettanomyces bruxellensis AWRI1499]KAF6014817.1 multiprotein-bridging factor 1 [Brettanomyces bruxellensis]QOU21285.1 multiprotein-bridging factor 1 [Brettanomyces bruxellensis]VUG19249.1 MBF1 [Brettanomyces bruxellensis]